MIDDENLENSENDENYAEAQLKVCQAFIQFNSFFSEYIKTMNPDLWKKAVDYAKDSVDIPGVELKLLDEDELE
jgi:hypothetical protein